MLGLVGGAERDVAQSFLHGSRDSETGVGAEPRQQLSGFRPALELERLLGALRHSVGGAAAEVAGIDVGTLSDEILYDLIQATEGRAV